MIVGYHVPDMRRGSCLRSWTGRTLTGWQSMQWRSATRSETASSPSGEMIEHVSKVSNEVGDIKFTIRWEQWKCIKGEQRSRGQQVHHQVRAVNMIKGEQKSQGQYIHHQVRGAIKYQRWAKKSETASSPSGESSEQVSKVSNEVGDSKFTIRWEEWTCIKGEQRSRGQ